MTIKDYLKDVEGRIQTTEEREYFLIHEARYAYILEQIQTLIKRSRQAERLRVLDVGCFPYHLGAILEMMGCDVYGISSSHEPIKNKKVFVCNIETDKFPFKDNFFDLVVCTEVLEHLPQSPAHALSEMYRVTMPQGYLALTTPNIARSINRGKLLLGKSVMYPLSQMLEHDGKGSNLYHRHNREYTLKELETLFTHTHWRIENATHFVSYTPFRRRMRPDPIWLKGGKIANYILMMIVSSLRDTLFVLGRKEGLRKT
jgi:2-polyprenyl-3-methyl-5-hydroxy-6-metoxy-1,4-benzoquinol methylase